MDIDTYSRCSLPLVAAVCALHDVCMMMSLLLVVVAVSAVMRFFKNNIFKFFEQQQAKRISFAFTYLEVNIQPIIIIETITIIDTLQKQASYEKHCHNV